MVSSTVFFLWINYSYVAKISINFVDFCSKPTICILFKFDTGFFSCCTLNRVVNILTKQHIWYILYLCLHGWYSCNWICFSIYLSIIYFIWYTTKYTTRCSRVLPNITRSTQLRGTQRSPEIAFKSTDVLVPDILTFLALRSVIQYM